MVPFFAGCRRFTTMIPPPYDWGQEVVRNASDIRGLKGLDPEVEQFAEATHAEQKAFVRDVRSFVRDHDPTKPVVPIPEWPGLEDVTRTWRAGAWRTRSLNTPWTQPTLLVKIPHEYVVGILFGPAAPGVGEAWLGPGPAYFDDDAAYDVESAAEGLAAWALSATGAQPDITELRALITPSWTVDLVEALTEMCRLLGIGLPKN